MTRRSFVLSLLAAALAAAASGLGLLVPGIYRDPPAMIPALRGQDLVTLATLPVLVIAVFAARGGSARGLLVALGVLGYLLYAAIGAAMAYTFNSLFLVYIAMLSVVAFALARLLASTDPAAIAAGFGGAVPRRTLSLFLVVMAAMVAFPELGQLWNAYRTGLVPEIVARSGTSTSFVHALDLGFVAPLSVLAGILLWRRRAGGYLLATIMLVKAATMGLALLSMTWFSAREGYPVELGLSIVYGVIAAGGLAGTIWLLARGLTACPRTRDSAAL
jgi:hypothetical protein